MKALLRAEFLGCLVVVVFTYGCIRLVDALGGQWFVWW